MKLTTRGRYSLTALVDLINSAAGKAVRLQDISTRQGISLHYLEQLFRQLRIAGVVNSVRGPGGGYVLSRDSSEITIYEVLKAVNEIVSYSDILRLPENPTRESVQAHKAITRLDQAALEVLKQPVSSLL